MKDIIQELLYDITRERDIKQQALLIKECAKKLNEESAPKIFPLPKNVFISSGINPETYFEIIMPAHMVKISFLNKKGNKIGNEYKSYPYGDRFLIEADGIPSLLIKKIKVAPLDWEYSNPASVILYVYEPGHKSLFDIDAWHKLHPYVTWKRYKVGN